MKGDAVEEFRDASLGLLSELAQPTSHDTVLDYASGAGIAGFDLAPDVRAVEAADELPDMLEEGRRLAGELGLVNVAFTLVDLYALPYKDGSFSLVACHNAFHLLPEPVTALGELLRVTSPGGRLVIVDPAVDQAEPRLGQLRRSSDRPEDILSVGGRLGFRGGGGDDAPARDRCQDCKPMQEALVRVARHEHSREATVLRHVDWPSGGDCATDDPGCIAAEVRDGDDVGCRFQGAQLYMTSPSRQGWQSEPDTSCDSAGRSGRDSGHGAGGRGLSTSPAAPLWAPLSAPLTAPAEALLTAPMTAPVTAPVAAPVAAPLTAPRAAALLSVPVGGQPRNASSSSASFAFGMAPTMRCFSSPPSKARMVGMFMTLNCWATAGASSTLSFTKVTAG